MYKTLRNGDILAEIYPVSIIKNCTLNQRINMKHYCENDSGIDPMVNYKIVVEGAHSLLKELIADSYINPSIYKVIGYIYSSQPRWVCIEHDNIVYTYPEELFEQFKDSVEYELEESFKYYTKELEELETALLTA